MRVRRAFRTQLRDNTLFVVAIALAMLSATVSPAWATLSPSTFNAADGNLVVDGSETDWASPPGGLQKGEDKPTGQSDDSFGQGTKEDTAVPSVVDGSIPNNKSDLTRFYVATEKVSGSDFLYLAWERVQEPSGTTNMDFEFNQSSTISANNVTPVRTAGDLLIKYDLSQGGTNPTLGYHKWVTGGGTAAALCEASNSLPCWGKVNPIVAPNFEGSINGGTVTDPILIGSQTDPRSLSARTFGEASINLTGAGILPAPGSGSCVAFGSAYLKSRSSDAFTAALKDFIAPAQITISNCAALTIIKHSVGGTGSFSFVGTGTGIDANFAISTASTNPNSKAYPALVPGSYTVKETVPTGWDLTTLSCTASGTGTSAAQDGVDPTKANITLGVGGSVTCTYTDTKKPTLTVNKVTDPTNDAGKFNLQIDGATAGTGGNVGNGGTTGAVPVTIASHTVGETAGTGTALTDYTSVISGDCDAGGNVTLAAGDNKTCTITNTRLPRLTINKVCSPTDDTGKFDLRLDGTVKQADAACGTGVGPFNSTIGSHTVSELAGTGTDLGNYASVIGGDCAANGSITLATGDNKTCTITNTRRLFKVIVLVCDQSDNTLYSSSVTFDGSTKNSLGTAPAGLTEAQLCGITGGARYTDKAVATYSASLTIALTEQTPTP